MKRTLCGLGLVLASGCGGPSFGPDRPATPQEQAVAASAESSLSTFNTDSIDADTFGNMANAIFGLANGSYEPGQTVVLPHGLYTACATIAPDRVDFHCTMDGSTLSGFVSRTVSGTSRVWQLDLSAT